MESKNSITLHLTPDMLERINRCRDVGETLEECALDLLWLGVLRMLDKRLTPKTPTL